MAKKFADSGNHISLRAKAWNKLIRFEQISGNLGSIGDFLVSSIGSAALSLIVLAGTLFICISLVMSGAGLADVTGKIIPVAMVALGGILIALNALFINPSQGSQLLVTLRYIQRLVNNNTFKEVVTPKPFRFCRTSVENKIFVESMYRSPKPVRRYTAIMAVQGAVAPTSFDDDLIVMRNLNSDALESLEKDTLRITANLISSPKIEPIKVAANATPAMRQRARDLNNTIRQLGHTPSLQTYVILNAPSINKLKRRIQAQFNFFDKGLVVSARLLADDELKTVFNRIYR